VENLTGSTYQAVIKAEYSMKKVSKIVMCIMSMVVIVFLLPLSAIAGYSSWTQTTQADFDAGTKTNIDTTTESGTFRVAKTAEAIDQQQITQDTNFHLDVSPAAQSFKPSINCILTKVQVYVKKGYGTSATFYLKSDNNNSPGNTLASKTITSLGVDYVWKDVDFTDTNLTAGTRYWIYTPQQADADWIWWGYAYDNPYADGDMYTTELIPYYDFAFKVYEQHYQSPSEAVDQSFTTGQDDEINTYPQSLAQSFKTSINCICTKIEIYIKKVGSPANLTVYLKADNNNWPGDTLASVTILAADVGTTLDYEIANIADTALTVNTRYWIYLPVVGDVSNHYHWGININSASYANGNAWDSAGGNATGADFLFKVYEQHSSSNLISQNHHFGTNLTSWLPMEVTKVLNGQILTIKTQTAPDNGGVPGTWESERELDSNDKPQSTIYSDTWFRWRAYLLTDGTKTPVVDDITVNYSCKATMPVLSSPTNGSTLYDSTPTLTWSNSTDNDGDTLTYRILVDNNLDFSSPEVDVSNIAQGMINTSYISPTLVDDTYYWKVCANDGAINSDWSTTWSFTVDTAVSISIVSTIPKDNGYFTLEEDTEVEMRFNREMSSPTMTTENIRVTNEDGEDVTLTEIVYVSSVTTITPLQKQMEHCTEMKYCTQYTVKVSTGVTDIHLNRLTNEASFSFTTLIPEERIVPVTVEHKIDGVTDRVRINNPARTFPEGSKRCYINLIETDAPSASNYVEGTARRLKCYKVDDSGNQIDIGQLDSPVAISIPYPSDTKDKKNLKIYFYNKDIDRWELVKGSGDGNPDDSDYYVTGEVTRTNIEYCVGGLAAGALIENYCNYPNPFKAGKEDTTIRYELKEDAKITISIYDLLGQLVKRIEIPKRTLGRGERGTNEVRWNGKNERGRVVANGGYYCVVEADTETGKHMKKTRKIMVIK
jgi:hypothetical protein